MLPNRYHHAHLTTFLTVHGHAIRKVPPMKTKTLHQTIHFKATAHALYEALMDSKKHAAFTEAQATISRKAGGTFQAYDGYATGKNIELIPDKKIVQSWRASDWPEGHHSLVTFEFKEKNGGDRPRVHPDRHPSGGVSRDRAGLARMVLGPPHGVPRTHRMRPDITRPTPTAWPHTEKDGPPSQSWH